jgi:LmbE family N-acetylglucosaminyl deacetylase
MVVQLKERRRIMESARQGLKASLVLVASAGLVLLMVTLFGGSQRSQAAAPADDGKLRIIVLGAHPDDAELKAGGTAALWAAQGHHVKFVSVTNGDIGHAEMSGGQLAKRRTAEVKEAAKVLGIETEVLDIHDGELMPTLENRREIVRLIRQWNADLVMGHRPNDYHPDHRYVGVLMQDAAYMVTVKFFCPDVPQMAKNPVFMYVSDGFQKPNPFQPDIVVATDSVMEKKQDAIWKLQSQIESLWATGNFEKVVPIPTDPQGHAQRRKQQDDRTAGRDRGVAQKYRDKLIELYGPEKGKTVQYAEAFEVCEYGRRPSAEELKTMFPISVEK